MCRNSSYILNKVEEAPFTCVVGKASSIAWMVVNAWGLKPCLYQVQVLWLFLFALTHSFCVQQFSHLLIKRLTCWSRDRLQWYHQAKAKQTFKTLLPWEWLPSVKYHANNCASPKYGIHSCICKMQTITLVHTSYEAPLCSTPQCTLVFDGWEEEWGNAVPL